MKQRLHIALRGAVQGVGFRPFVYRLASGMGLPGWVLNSSQGVFIEVEGEKSELDAFILRLGREKPERASIQSLEYSFLDPVKYTGFEIRSSDQAGDKTCLVLPDVATCGDCRREIFDPGERRYRYPFTNCTHCGPRFSIMEALPYDRGRTSMKTFALCGNCRREYEDPEDRRFHAQPIACPDCGPHIELWDRNGRILAGRGDALGEAAAKLRAGGIIAVKGLGGFHLMADARDQETVSLLRERKHREEKPFALMYPSLAAVRSDCVVTPLEERLLLSPEAPIVLLRRRDPSQVAGSVAPSNPYLGVMLPYTPLHHLLLRELDFPLVATSGNLSDEPICIDEREALQRLGDLADLFLVHNRPILRPLDDSIVRVSLGRELVLRRARGYAPLPLPLVRSGPGILAVGGQLKNTIALTAGDNVFISQHIGDLESGEAMEVFRSTIAGFRTLFGCEPARIVADMHPDYLSTQFAATFGIPVIKVQHHYAHVLACMAENELEAPVLGVTWDGTGFGLDGTVWGGEFLLVDESSFRRVATLRHFRLPGAERAVREPRRSALGVLFEVYGDELFERRDLAPLRSFRDRELSVLRLMLGKGVNSPVCTSAGRLFDAVASITSLRQVMSFEGQAAMELEFALVEEGAAGVYPFALGEAPISGEYAPAGGSSGSRPQMGIVVDWEPLLRELLRDNDRQTPVGKISTKFHNTLVEMIAAVVDCLGVQKVVITGGCFQNRYLAEKTVHRLEAMGCRPYWHQRIPPNDGGIAPGQVFAAVRQSWKHPRRR